MKRSLAISSLAVLITLSSLSLAAASEKGKVRQRRIEPYVRVHVTPRKLKLGRVPQPGMYYSRAKLKVHVKANCPHGPVMASATPLETPEGASIPPERISVIIPDMGEYSLGEPVAITGPDPMGPGAYHIDLRFRIDTVLQDPAGTYRGTFIFTVGL